MLGTSFGNVELLDGAKDLYMASEIKRLQNFYGLTFEDLFDEDALSNKGVKGKDLEYVLENREKEATIKSKEAWEMKEGLFKSKRWLKLSEHYGIKQTDIRNIEILKQKGLGKEDISFITGKKEIPKEKFTDLENLKREATELGIEFNARIGEDKLKEKIEAFKLTKNEQ